ncbi:DUF2339 domain-containing protein [Candidatus Gracilibacteria bacterium]|nr:DUF2339 domain-containing protein [Candidatus Gracilibacteria bacterium]
MEILIFLGFVGLFIWIYSLGNKLMKLETKISFLLSKTTNKIKTTSNIEKKSSDNFPWEETSLPTQKTVVAKKYSTEQKKESDFHLEDFLGRKFFAVLGIISIVCAIGFFTLWTFSHGWVGPSGRIAIGILFSLILLGTGEFIRPKYPKFSPVILSAGIAGLLITTFIARNVYGFLTPEQSLLAYSLEVATGLVLSLKNNSRLLGNFSIIGGLISPILVKSPEPNAIGLLTFLVILSIAGFIISTQKKWSEILGILFLGVLGFEIGILDQELLKDSPLVFLAFIFGLHILFGSGSFYRQLKTKTIKKTSEISGAMIFEILLFIFSIFSANMLASFIFETQAWEHLGFFVLFQGFLFFGLAEFFKSQKLSIFKNLSIGATLLSIIFATIWEIGSENNLILTLLLTLEGILFCFAGKSISQKVFEIFGKLSILLAIPFFFDINNFGESTFMTFILIGSLIYSIGNPKNIADKIWGLFSIIFSSFLIFFWIFEFLHPELSSNYEFLIFIIPSIWGSLLAFSILKVKNLTGPIMSLIFMGILNIVLWNNECVKDLSNWLSLVIVLAGNFTVLTSFFIKDTSIDIAKNTKKIATIFILSISTFSVFQLGINILEEPMRTLLWIVWGGLLFLLGNSKDWPHFRYFGIGTFCFLITKLYLTDIWQWETWVRFIAFFVLGIALLGISFLYQKNIKTNKPQ